MLLSAQFKAVFIELPTRTSIDFIISDRWPSSSWLQLSQYGVHQSIHDELDKLRSKLKVSAADARAIQRRGQVAAALTALNPSLQILATSPAWQWHGNSMATAR